MKRTMEDYIEVAQATIRQQVQSLREKDQPISADFVERMLEMSSRSDVPLDVRHTMCVAGVVLANAELLRTKGSR